MSSSDKDINKLNQLIRYDKDWDGFLERLKTDEGKEEAKRTNKDGDFPLHYACDKKPPLEVVEALLEAYPEGANTANNYGQLPLHKVFEYGASVEVVKALLKANPETIKKEDKWGNLPLHYMNVALMGGAATELVSTLLEAYPEGTRHIDKYGKLPIHYVDEDASAEIFQQLFQAYAGKKDDMAAQQLHNAAQSSSDHEVWQVLIKAYPKGAAEVDRRGRNPLHILTQNKAPAEIVSTILEAYPEATRHIDEKGKLPIHYVKEDASLELVRHFFEAYAGKKDEMAAQQLLTAAQSGSDHEVWQVLIQAYPKGAAEVNKRGRHPLHIVIKDKAPADVILSILEEYPEGTRHIDEEGKLPIHYLSKEDATLELVGQLFEAYAGKKDDTAAQRLHKAVQSGSDHEGWRVLIEGYPQGAAEVDKRGRNALHILIQKEAQADVISTILAVYPEGAKMADKYGMFPLQYACKNGSSPDVLLQLIKAFPKAATKIDKEGKLPLHVVHENTPDKVVEALVQAYREKVRKTLPKAYEVERGKIRSFAEYYNVTRSKNKFQYQILPLQHALKSGAPLKVVHKLLELYPNGGFYGDELRQLPLHYAFLYRATREVAEAVLKSCRDAISQFDVERRLPLHYACREGVAPDVLEELLAAYPDGISKADSDGRLPIHHACDKNPQDETIKLLTSKHPNGAVIPDSKGDLPTHLLVRNEGQSSTQQEILLTSMMTNKGACNSIGSQGVVLPLHIAAKCNVGFEILDQLLRTYPEAASHFQVNPPKGNRLALDILEEQRGGVPKKIWTDPFNLKSDLLFSFNPDISLWKEEPERLLRLEQRIIYEMEEESTELSAVSRRVWVWMCESNLTKSVESVLSKLGKDACAYLGSIQTKTGQSLLVGASPDCAQIIRSHLLFVGRYDIARNERPLHESATCLVLRARDFGTLEGAAFQRSSNLIGSDAGDPVVIKFMKEKDQFDREKLARVDLGLTSEAAVSFMRDTFKLEKQKSSRAKMEQRRMEEDFPPLVPYVDEYDVDRFGADAEKTDDTRIKTRDERFKNDRDEMENSSEFQGLHLKQYDYALVMPEADRTLDGIYKHERPKINQVRQIMEELAKALQRMHRRGIIHGDLKMLNVVRIKGRITLIDMDASCRTAKHIQYDEESDFVGAKFSSGVLPPEMIALLDKKSINDYEKYWKKSGIDSGSSLWKKVKPSMKPDGAEGYVVKTFNKGSVKDLPYEPVRPSEAIDTWSFGLLLLKLLCSDKPLFNVSRDDDLTSVQDFHELYTWDKNVASTYKDRIGRVEDFLANDLLERLLVCRDRLATMSDILQHPFFKDNTHDMTQDIMDEVVKLRYEANTRDQEQRKRDDEQRKLLESIKEQTARIEENTTKLVFMSEGVKEQLLQSTQCLCKAIYEADEVKVPTTFVIFKSKLDPLSNNVDVNFQQTVQTSQNTTSLCGLIISKWKQKKAEFEEKCRELQQMRRKEQAEAFVNYLEVAEGGVQDAVEIIEGIDNFLESPQKKIMERAQSSVKKWLDAYKAETAYMYLVDERTRKPVVDEKYPPYEITSTSDKMRDLIPFMQVGIKAMSIVSFGTQLASTVCGLPPITIFPKWIRDSASGVVESLDKESSVVEFGVVHNSFVASKNQDVTNESQLEEAISYRGADLRQLENFFAENDKERKFAGLCRVCGPDGSAMWTTEDGVREITQASLNSNSEASDGEKDGSGQPRSARPTLSRSVGRYFYRLIYREKSDDRNMGPM